jgi:hypothetical protein
MMQKGQEEWIKKENEKRKKSGAPPLSLGGSPSGDGDKDGERKEPTPAEGEKPSGEGAEKKESGTSTEEKKPG